jgi:putative spermidine/putrescine transport system permease protein
MALPAYATPGQRVWHYSYLGFCAFVLFFLVAPLIVVIPLSFTSGAFLSFTPEMLRLDPEAFSLRWYRMLMGDCSDKTITTVCSDKWKIGAINSLFIAVFATLLSTGFGTLAALGLSRPEMPYRKLIMALMISPLIVPLIITASGMFLFFSKVDLAFSFLGLILAHAVLGLPFVVITVTATLTGFDTSLTRAALSLGSNPIRNFFKIQMPLIMPGVISGALFAFITSFDEVVVVLFVGGPEQLTLPRQMWAGIRQEISPTILSAATVLVLVAIMLLASVEMLRRRSERLRGISPA